MIPTLFFFGGAKRTDQTAGRGEGLTSSMTIAWDNQFKMNNIMWKVPHNIRMNDNIVVREDEIAVFYRDGKALAYLDKPDRYALTSQNVAVLGWLQKVFAGVVQQAEVYYLVKQLNVTLGKMKQQGLKVVDFAASLNDIEQGTLANSKPHFANLGIEIVQVSGMNIPLPDTVKAAIDKMGAARTLGRTSAAAYQQFAVADALTSAAANRSEERRVGVGLGAGIGLGYGMGSQLPGMIAQPPQGQQQQQMKACPKCGAMNP